ncbi:MAG: hypothetical protein ACE5IK_01860 [Acidobacteriota bacterium]
MGITEEAEIALVILDVEVHDEGGHPVRGLTREDFFLSLGPRPWPIYSVDDLCDCDSQGQVDRARHDVQPGAAGPTGAENVNPSTRRPDPAAGAASSGPLPPGSSVALAPLLAPNVARTIIYFDFSQLQADGRSRAFSAARRWARETMNKTDSVMVAGYTSSQGLVRLLQFTNDRDLLLATLEDAQKNKSLIDDFPLKFNFRVRSCQSCIHLCQMAGGCPPLGCDDCCGECTVSGLQELYHGRRALTALREFLAQLESVPGRKNLIFLHQNNVLYPGRFYRFPAEEADFYIGTQTKLLDEVGARATASRTTVYSLQAGRNQMLAHNLEQSIAGEAVNLGANLADFTGGDYGRAPRDLVTVMDRVGRACACIYRIAFKPPDVGRSRVYNARVEVRGKRLPFSYRVQYLTPADRAMRTARAVLTNPHGWTDVLVHAALVPMSRSRQNWDLELSVVLNLDAVDMLSLGGRETARLDVGAVLDEMHEEGGGKSWEMLAGTEVRKTGATAHGRWIVHRHRFTGMKPGRYRVSAFARNRDLNLFGGDEVTVDLPKRSREGIVGPVPFRPNGRYFPAALPAREDVGKIESRRTEVRSGPLPISPEIHRGQPLAFKTWLCPSAKHSRSARNAPSDPAETGRHLLDLHTLTRFVVHSGRPEPLPGEPGVAPFGDNCVEIEDNLATQDLETGTYTYLVVWRPPGVAEPLSSQNVFQVMEPDGNASPAPPSTGRIDE